MAKTVEPDSYENSYYGSHYEHERSWSISRAKAKITAAARHVEMAREYRRDADIQLKIHRDHLLTDQEQTAAWRADDEVRGIRST